MSVARKAFEGLWGDSSRYAFLLKYSGRFSDYNANIKFYDNTFEFGLSKKWRGVDEDIIVGLLQSLMSRVRGKKVSSMNIDFYNSFVKRLHIVVDKNKSDPLLLESFHRVNGAFFDELLDVPNLEWGRDSIRKLASYDFHSDTIRMSTVLEDARVELLDYVMYHELLHKKLSFDNSGNNTRYHTSEFREAEKRYPNHEKLEKELQYLRPKNESSRRRKGFLSRIFE